ncbi:MAG: hypothetical protein GKR89_30675 [Candidatus Latescibacteria bacterium]|nr:hypothetical protein [Candidatus Latescibacterota bacterium]
MSDPTTRKDRVGARTLGRWLVLLALAAAMRSLLALSRFFEGLCNRLSALATIYYIPVARRKNDE